MGTLAVPVWSYMMFDNEILFRAQSYSNPGMPIQAILKLQLFIHLLFSKRNSIVGNGFLLVEIKIMLRRETGVMML